MFKTICFRVTAISFLATAYANSAFADTIQVKNLGTETIQVEVYQNAYNKKVSSDEVKTQQFSRVLVDPKTQHLTVRLTEKDAIKYTCPIGHGITKLNACIDSKKMFYCYGINWFCRQ